jgi:hypothetical protein
MGGGVKVPGPSAEEKALQKSQSELLNLQTEILKQQRQQQAVLLPFLAEQEGFQVETDQFGNVTKISKTPTELENMRKDLETQLTKRSLDALAGNLPVSPGLERDLGKQEQTLREKLGAQLGPGFETSTPGIEALAKQRESADVLREGARTAQLTLAEQLGITRQQQDQFSRQSSQDVLRQQAIGDPLTLAGAFGQTASGFGKAQEPFIAQRQMQLQASIANSQSRSSMFGAGIGLIGSLFSDPRLKANAIVISVRPDGLKVYEYEMGGQRRIGMYADEVAKVYPHAVGVRMGYKVVQYGATRWQGRHSSGSPVVLPAGH